MWPGARRRDPGSASVASDLPDVAGDRPDTVRGSPDAFMPSRRTWCSTACPRSAGSSAGWCGPRASPFICGCASRSTGSRRPLLPGRCRAPGGRGGDHGGLRYRRDRLDRGQLGGRHRLAPRGASRAGQREPASRSGRRRRARGARPRRPGADGSVRERGGGLRRPVRPGRRRGQQRLVAAGAARPPVARHRLDLHAAVRRRLESAARLRLAVPLRAGVLRSRPPHLREATPMIQLTTTEAGRITPLPDSLAARRLLSRGQVAFLGALAAAFAVIAGTRAGGLGPSPLWWAEAALAVITIGYVAAIGFMVVMVLCAGGARVLQAGDPVPDHALPLYTVLVHVPAMSAALQDAVVGRLSAIDYPRLQVLLLAPGGTTPPRPPEASPVVLAPGGTTPPRPPEASPVVLPSWVEVVPVPPDGPGTTASARDAGLDRAAGEF